MQAAWRSILPVSIAIRPLALIALTIENRTRDAHRTGIRLSVPSGSSYDLAVDGRSVQLAATGRWDHPWRAEIELRGQTAKIELVRSQMR
jgi:hypothetical protein